MENLAIIINFYFFKDIIQMISFTNCETYFRVTSRAEQQRNSSSPTKSQKPKLVG